MKNIKKIILFSLFGALSIGCASIMVGKANNAKVASADVSDDAAAWHFEASVWWENVPKSDVINSYMSFSNEFGNEYKRTTITKPTASSKNTLSYNSLEVPNTFNIYVKNNGFNSFMSTKKTIKWKISVKYLSDLVYASEDFSYTFETTLTDDLNTPLNIRSNLSVSSINISPTGITNYNDDKLCKSFDVLTTASNYPYLNNHSFRKADGTDITYDARPYQEVGYSFDGYFGSEKSSVVYYDADLNPQDISDIDTTLVAKFSKRVTNYTLAWNYNGGTLVTPGTPDGSYPEGKEITAPELTKTGYEFSGWDPTLKPTLTKDVTYVAQWKAKEYTITYLDKGGNAFSGTHGSGYPTTHTYGTPTTLVNPTRTDYGFIGWFKDEGCTQLITVIAGDEYTDDFNLYADWIGDQHVISFDTLGFANSVASLTYRVGDNTDLPVPTGIRYGYAFDGWYDNKTYSGKKYTSTSDLNKDYNLFAKWKYDFSNDGAYRIICKGYLTGVADLWTQKDVQVNVTMFAHDGDATPYYTSQTISVYEERSTVEASTLICDVTTVSLPEELEFNWYRKYELGLGDLTVNSSLEVYYQGNLVEQYDQSFTHVKTTSDVNYSIPRQCSLDWEKEQRLVKKNANVATFTIADNLDSASFDVPKGSSMPTLLNKDYLKKDGTVGQYSFVKPSLTDSQGTSLELQGFYDINANKKYFDADLNPVADAKASDSMTLYPGFLQDVNYIDGATTSPSTYLAGLNNTITFAPAYTKENAEFTGWSYTENGEVVTTIDNTKKDELNLYSIWSYYVYFDVDGGSSVDPQLVAQTKTATKPTDPTKEVEGIRYQFLGWYLNADLYDFATPVTESITLKAKWVSYVDVFVITCMHPEIDPSNPGTGSCITEGWYANAKAAFAELNDAEKTAFTSDIEYAVYYERFVAWARANGETFDGINIVQITSFNPLIYSENSGTVLVIILSIIFVSALLAGFVIVRKKKQY